MGLFERSPIPGAPYLLAGVLSMWALLHCFELPPEPEQVRDFPFFLIFVDDTLLVPYLLIAILSFVLTY